MSQPRRPDRVIDSGPSWVGPSERDSHTEHQAALAATVFQKTTGDAFELVLELEAGELRVRRSI
ncbi:MAG: hypothetical protein JRJ58_04485 [Deltaproteobacteria bacterium]|nr:hypothetical protein [Deltaproteobacteria bacterium]